METINFSPGTVKQTKKATDGLWRCCRSSTGGALPWWIASLQRSHFWKTAIWREQALCQAHACSAGTKAADCILRKIISWHLRLFLLPFQILRWRINNMSREEWTPLRCKPWYRNGSKSTLCARNRNFVTTKPITLLWLSGKRKRLSGSWENYPSMSPMSPLTSMLKM